MFHMRYKTTNISILIFLLFSSFCYAQGENKTFNKVCSSCHNGGIKGFISGAPSIEDKQLWLEYLEKHSIDEIKQIVLEGSEEHKVKGGCKKCSNAEIIGAINYMLRRVSSEEVKP